MATTSTLHYDYRDLLKAPRLALSGKNLLAQARPFVYGYISYLLLTYIALLIEGMSLGEIWNNFAIYPFVNLGLSHWYTKLIWILGIVSVAGFYDYGNLCVAKFALEELKGNLFFSREEAAKEARANLRPLWIAGALLLLLVVVLSLIQGLIGSVVHIPYLGEIIYAVIYVVPFFLWSLFVVFIAFGLTTAILTLPAIVTAREKDAFGASFYVYNIIWQQPLRWVTHTVVGAAMAKVGIFILGYFFMRAMQLTSFTTTLFGGDKADRILQTGYAGLIPIQKILNFFCTLYPGSRIGYNMVPSKEDLISIAFSSQSSTESFAALLITFGLVIMWLVVIAYGINIITCSQLISFILIRFREDNERLGDSPSAGKDDPRELIPRLETKSDTNH